VGPRVQGGALAKFQYRCNQVKLAVFTLRIDPETGRLDDPELETFLAERRSSR